jgi:hypothetical protein
MNHLLAKYSTNTTAQDSRLSTNCERRSRWMNICTRIATIATAVRIDSTGNSHILTRSFESGVR